MIIYVFNCIQELEIMLKDNNSAGTTHRQRVSVSQLHITRKSFDQCVYLTFVQNHISSRPDVFGALVH
jgi:hypothetical protein